MFHLFLAISGSGEPIRKISQIPLGTHPNGCGPKPMGSHFGVGEFTTHFRSHFSGDWDVHWGRTGFLTPWPNLVETWAARGMVSSQLCGGFFCLLGRRQVPTLKGALVSPVSFQRFAFLLNCALSSPRLCLWRDFSACSNSDRSLPAVLAKALLQQKDFRPKDALKQKTKSTEDVEGHVQPVVFAQKRQATNH